MRVLEFRVEGRGFVVRVKGLGVRVEGLGARVEGLGARVACLQYPAPKGIGYPTSGTIRSRIYVVSSGFRDDEVYRDPPFESLCMLMFVFFFGVEGLGSQLLFFLGVS